MNAFTSVRPRGVNAPSKAPRKTNHSKAPKSGNVHLLLDSKGRQTVSLKPRVLGAISIEPREQAIASRDKRDAIKRGMSQ